MPKSSLGRPRSQATRDAILTATRDLLLEEGYERLSIQAVAARAGAGRQTVYRWWDSKAALAVDVVVEGYLPLPGTSIPDSGVLRADLVTWLSSASAFSALPAASGLLRTLAGAASESERQASRLFATITGPVRGALIDRLRSGKDLGQLSPATSESAVADALLGTALLRLLAPIPAPIEVDGIVDLLLGTPQSHHRADPAPTPCDQK